MATLLPAGQSASELHLDSDGDYNQAHMSRLHPKHVYLQ